MTVGQSDGSEAGGRETSVVSRSESPVSAAGGARAGVGQEESGEQQAADAAGSGAGKENSDSVAAGGAADGEAAGAGAGGPAAVDEPGEGRQEPAVGAGGDGQAADVAAPAGQRSEPLGERFAALEGEVRAVGDMVRGQTAILKELGGGGKENGAGTDEFGPLLKKELKGVVDRISTVERLVSDVSQGLKQPETKTGDDRQIVEGLKVWITETLSGGMNRLDERISGLVDSGDRQAAAFDGVKLNVDVVKQVGAAVGTLEERLQVYTKDLSRSRELGGGAMRWVLLGAVAVAAPALLLAGAFAGQQWQVLPLEDGTGGWRGHVWQHYGSEIVGCVQKAYRDGSSFECVVDVRPSVDQVRRRTTGR